MESLGLTEMKRLNQCSALLCVLTATLILGACTPEASGVTVKVEPAGANQLPQTNLEAVLHVPTTLPDGDSVELEFILINNSETGLYVLKWYTPLEGIAGEIFCVERDGQAIPYQGLLATRGAPSAEAYVLLEPGASASAVVDLATAYDFAQAGEYTIEFMAPTISHVATTETEMATSLDDLGPVQMPSNKVTVEIKSSSALTSLRIIRGPLELKPGASPDNRVAEPPPPGHVEPVSGFGLVWRGEVAGPEGELFHFYWLLHFGHFWGRVTKG